MVYEKFEEFLLPGNYALTKSMEMMQISKSGTLWYMKKYLVWYYFIFLTNELQTRSYINKVKDIFESYVNSIDEKIREEARKYFFPECELINCNSEKFKTFEEFKGKKEFDDLKEKSDYEEDCKKYYMAFLLDSGGQGGAKAYLKENIYKEDFNMTKLDKLIRENEEFKNKKFKTEKEKDKKFVELKNDYHAIVRNQRQILFYYGYFHSKSSGTNQKEFSSLTPIGELALYSNYDEFFCIWEHQKIKMISQPPVVAIKNVPSYYKNKADSYFGISYSPYLDILRYLKDYNKITKEEYKYIVSRNKSQINIKKWKENEDIIQNIELIEEKVKKFNRKSDIEDNDSGKELKKYLLGMVDLPKDKGNNKFGYLTTKYELKKEFKEKFEKMLLEYEKLEKYKEKKYLQIFEDSEKELRKKYKDENYKIDLKIEVSWKLYSIRPEKIILLGIMQLNEEDSSMIFEKYKNILKSLEIKSKAKLEKELKKYKDVIENGKEFIEEEWYEETDISEITKESKEDLLKKIKEVSALSDSVIGYEIERKRNMTLISLLKSYYIQVYSLENKLLKCECCGKTTFITKKDEPYLEYHHLIPFGSENQGPDHYLNIFALCPECHRKMHYLKLDEKEGLYKELSNNNYFNKTILNRLSELKEEKILKSYQIDYLLYENAITESERNNLLS